MSDRDARPGMFSRPRMSTDSGPYELPSSGRETPLPVRKGSKTQEEQNKEDEMSRHKVLQNLVQSWQDRLQLISLITTFFAAAEINFLVITTGSDPMTAVRELTNACFNGALVLHAFSAAVSFLASFVLIGYKLKEAKTEQDEEEGKTPKAGDANDPKKQEEGRATTTTALKPSIDLARTTSSRARSPLPSMPAIFSSNPHMVQTYFRHMQKPPVHLLERLHALCTLTAFCGFVLAFVGIIAFAWAWHVRSVGIFTSSCLAASVIVGVVMVNTGTETIIE